MLRLDCCVEGVAVHSTETNEKQELQSENMRAIARETERERQRDRERERERESQK